MTTPTDLPFLVYDGREDAAMAALQQLVRQQSNVRPDAEPTKRERKAISRAAALLRS